MRKRMSSIKRFICNDFSENCYLVWNEQLTGVIIDPGCYPGEECERVKNFAGEHGIKPAAILLTHAHFDHVYGVKELSEYFKIPVYMNAADGTWAEYNSKFPLQFGMSAPDMSFDFIPVQDDEILSFDDMSFRVITTPGHSSGSVCYYSEGMELLFSGDTLFAGAIGRTDVPEGDYDSEIVSIMEKLIFLPGSTDVYPGHGRPTSIAAERVNNPFLEPFNEKEDDFVPDSTSPVTIHQ